MNCISVKTFISYTSFTTVLLIFLTNVSNQLNEYTNNLIRLLQCSNQIIPARILREIFGHIHGENFGEAIWSFRGIEYLRACHTKIVIGRGSTQLITVVQALFQLGRYATKKNFQTKILGVITKENSLKNYGRNLRKILWWNPRGDLSEIRREIPGGIPWRNFEGILN